MKTRLVLCMIIVCVCSAVSYAGDFRSAASDMAGQSGDFKLSSNIVRFGANGGYGKVASDRETTSSSLFRIFRSFRNASIGMFVPGGLIFTGSIIPLSILTAIVINSNTAVSFAEALNIANTFTLGGFYTCIAFLALSGVFILCGIVFAACAGAFYYKWASQKEIASYSTVSSDKPQFAHGLRIAL